MPLPPLSSLRTFEVAARCLSFTRAAEELNITQGAVSQQIKQLEARLGYALFERRPRQLALTEEGDALASSVRAALAQITGTLEHLEQRRHRGPLTVSVLASFGAKWLLPRLSKFHEAHPDIDVRLQTDDAMANLRNDGVDIAIRFGRGNYPGMDVTTLVRDRVIAVCSPDLVRGPEAIRSVDDLAHCRLLHDDDWRGGNEFSWTFWLDRFGITRTRDAGGNSFNRGDLMVQAAIIGRGVALTRCSLADEDLQAGRLVRPFPFSMPSPMAHYVVCLPERAHAPNIEAFRAWVVAEGARAAAHYDLAYADRMPAQRDGHED